MIPTIVNFLKIKLVEISNGFYTVECHGHVTTGLAWSIQLVSVGSVNTNGTLITDLSVGDFGAVFLTWHNA